MGSNRRIHAAVFSFIAGVIPPIPMLGRSKVGFVPQSRHLGGMYQRAASRHFHLGRSGSLLRFRVCSGGHAGAYGAGVVIDILLDIF
jgi:hypothetical protein